MGESRLYAAMDKIEAWQKRVSPRVYTPGSITAELTTDQQELIEAVWGGSDQTAQAVLAQSGIAPQDLDDLPRLVPPLSAAQFTVANSRTRFDWATAEAIHKSVSGHNGPMSMTMDYRWWHLFVLRQMQRGSDGALPDPPRFLLDGINPPFNVDVLDTALQGTQPGPKKSKDAHYRLDIAVRTYLRHAGGIWHRKSRSITDAPMRQGWWMVELARRASRHGHVGERDVYDALSATWRAWANRAAFSATRLAHPNCVAAYALAAERARCGNGRWPSGDQAAEIIDNLMRRTLDVAVPLVDPETLAVLAG